jgi:hypothetical protein
MKGMTSLKRRFDELPVLSGEGSGWITILPATFRGESFLSLNYKIQDSAFEAVPSAAQSL